MKIEKNDNGDKVFTGTFESSKHKIRKQPKELAIEKFIKKIIKRYKKKTKCF